jgi:hypothetical protein
MGANNCKSADDVQEVLDWTFGLQYTLLFAYAFNILVPTSDTWTVPMRAVLYLALTIFML